MKTIRAVMVLLSVSMLCACTRAERFGVWELERRLREADEQYAFDTQTLFRKEGVYHVFYRTDAGTLLLKAAEDERQRLTFVSLTATDAGMAEDFSALACAVTEVFWPREALADVTAQLQLADPGSFFRDKTLSAEYGRYRAVFFQTTKGVSLMLRYEQTREKAAPP
ncbi:MAG: hypothetical protein IJK89_03820 [Clostridia bacterium]|nr:hypothetical protein [Clostridia bacterium]